MVNEALKDGMRENFFGAKPDYRREILGIIRSNQSPGTMCDRLSD